MLYLVLVPVLLLVGLAVYIFFGGKKLPSAAESIIDDVLRADLPELVQGQSGFAISGDIKIWYEYIAPPGETHGTVMLISPMGGDGLFWPLAFRGAFLDAGYAVIRYDQRGAGLSDWIEAWDRKHPYSLVDMAGDAAAVLDALTIQRAHLVGVSLGGMVAQELAIHHLGRAASLTLIMTSAYAPDPDIPGLTTRTVLRIAMRSLPLLRYRILGGERNLIRERIAKMLQVFDFDDGDIREMATMVLYDVRKRRGINFRALLQHQAAVSVTPPRFDALQRLNVPALIIHGAEDEIIPIEHAEKLAAAIPAARTIRLEGVGHLFPPPPLPELTVEIIAHIESSNRPPPVRPPRSG